MIDIKKIKVYNPRDDGWDYETYLAIFKYVKRELGQEVLSKLRTSLEQKVLSSEVEEGLTLREYLKGYDGYFSTHPDVAHVVFVDGRFHSEYQNGKLDLTKKREEIAKETNSIPFIYGRSPLIETLYK